MTPLEIVIGIVIFVWAIHQHEGHVEETRRRHEEAERKGHPDSMFNRP